MGFIQKLRKYFAAKKYRNVNLKYTVRYLDSANHEAIAPEKMVEGLVFGVLVTEMAPEFLGFAAKQEKVSFEINQENQIIDLYYDRCNDFSYIVRYVNKSNNKEIWQHKCVENLSFGVQMVECSVTIEGYVCLTEAITVQVASRAIEVTFEYEKRRDLNCYVEYVDKVSGEAIHAPHIQNGLEYRSEYVEQAVDIPGYVCEFKERRTLVDLEENRIIFEYVKRRDLKCRVEYIDETSGNVIHPSHTQDGLEYQSEYVAQALEIPGYVCKFNENKVLVGLDENCIVFEYERRRDLTCQLEYIDKTSGEPIQSKCVIQGLMYLEEYVQTAPVFPGYICNVAEKSVLINLEENKIVFEYEKRRDLTGSVVCIEKESGKEIRPAYTLEGLIYRERIRRHAPKIPGYVPDVEMKSVWVKENDNEIVFTYEKRSDLSYCVRYIDAESDLELAEKKVVDGQIFDTMVTEVPLEIQGYVSAEAYKAIHIGEENNEAIFAYRKRSDLTCDIEYIDQETGESLIPKTVVEGLAYHTEFQYNAPEIRGYIPEVAQMVAQISTQGNQIAFVYTRRKDLSYIVRYVDRESGLDIAPVKTVDAQVWGVDVQESALDIPGFIQSENNRTLTLDIEGNEILFLYDRRGDIEYTVEYCEKETGKKLAEDKKVKDQLYGAVIRETSIDIEGYNLLSECEQQMLLEATDNILVFYYEKTPLCSYDVWYLETVTKKIIAPNKCVVDQRVGTNVIEHALEIEGYTALIPTKQMIHLEYEENEFRFFYEKNSTREETDETTELPMVEEIPIVDESSANALVKYINPEDQSVEIFAEKDQENDKGFDVCEVEIASETEDKGNVRVRILKDESTANWPIRRLVAFGANKSFVEAISEHGMTYWADLPGEEAIGNTEDYSWIETLSERRWMKVYEACQKLEAWIEDSALVLSCSIYKAAGFSAEEIAKKKGISIQTYQQAEEDMRIGILEWIDSCASELNFLTKDGFTVDTDMAKLFFGSSVWLAVEDVLKRSSASGCKWFSDKTVPFVICDIHKQREQKKFIEIYKKLCELLQDYGDYASFRRDAQKVFDANSLDVPTDVVLRKILESSDNRFRIEKLVPVKTEKMVIHNSHELETEIVRPQIMTEWQQLQRFLLEQFDMQPLLGSIELTDAEYKMLLDDFKVEYQRYLNAPHYDSFRSKMICIALVQIAIRESKSGALWPCVARCLNVSRNNTALLRLGSVFVNTMKQHKKAVFDSGEKVASVLMHCFVCNDGIEKLFDFLWAYYEIDLGRNMLDADVEGLQKVITEGGYFSRKQFLLQQTIDALKYLPDLSIQRLKAYLEWIDAAYWDPSFQPPGENRFTRGFEAWRMKNPEMNGAYTSEKREREKGKKHFSSPYISLNMNGGGFVLNLPSQRLPLNYTDAVAWRIVSEGKSFVACDTYEGVTSNMTVDTKTTLKASALLDEVRIELQSEEDVIHSFVIPADCYRAFDSNGIMLQGRHLASGRVYCYTNVNDRLITDVECVSQIQDGWLLCCYDFKRGTIVEFPDGSVTMVDYELSEGLCGSPAVERVFAQKNDDRHYPLYNRCPKLLIKTSEEHFLNGRMRFNGMFYHIRDLEYKSFELFDRTERVGYLMELPIKGNGFCDIGIDLPQEQSEREYHFAYIKDFDYRFENSGAPLPYMFVPRGSITVQYDGVMLGEGLEKHPHKNEFGFELRADEQWLKFAVPEINGCLHIEIPMISYRMDDGEWTIARPEEMWLSEFPSRIEFRCSNSEITLSVDENATETGQYVVYSKGKKQDIISCDLLALRSWLIRNRIKHDIYMAIGGDKFEFMSVYCRSFVVSARLEGNYDENVICGKFDIFGNGEYVASVYREEEMIAEYIPIQDGTFEISTDLEPGEYKAVIYETEADEFGFGMQLFEIGQSVCNLIDPGNIAGRMFYLRNVETLNLESNRLQLTHKRYWVKVLEQDEEDPHRYLGYMRIHDNLYSYPEIPVVVIIPRRNVIDRCQLLFIDDDVEESFLYDFATARIVCEEQPGIHRMERYRRYSMLDPEDIFATIFMD